MTKVIDQASEAAGTADDVDTTTNNDGSEDDETDELEQSFEDESWDDGDEEEDPDDSDSDDADEAEATDDSDDDADESDDAVELDDSDNDQEAEAERTAAKDTDKAKDADQTANQRAAAYRVQQKQEREAAKVKQQNDWIAEGKNDTQRALRRLEVDNYNNQVRTTTNELRERVFQAQQSIDLFKSKDPEVRNAMLDELDNFEARFVEKDANGDYIDIRVDPETGEKADVRRFLAKRAETIKRLTGLGAKQQEQAKKSQKKRTATLPSRTPAKKKADPMMDAFDEEAAS